jgi:hypothetical protein
MRVAKTASTVEFCASPDFALRDTYARGYQLHIGSWDRRTSRGLGRFHNDQDSIGHTRLYPHSVAFRFRVGGKVAVAPGQNRCVPGSWNTWSNSYKGDVWFTGAAAPQTLTLPAGTKAFYFYVEPNNLTNFKCSAISEAVSTGDITVTGDGGARYIGFYGDNGATLTSITVTCDDAGGFATGEYGIAIDPACKSTADLRSGGSTDTVRVTNQGNAEMPYTVQFVNAQGTVQGKPVAKSLTPNQSASNSVGSLMQQAGIKTFNPANLLQIVTGPIDGMTESLLQSVYTPTNGTPPVMMVYTCESVTPPK